MCDFADFREYRQGFLLLILLLRPRGAGANPKDLKLVTGEGKGITVRSFSSLLEVDTGGLRRMILSKKRSRQRKWEGEKKEGRNAARAVASGSVRMKARGLRAHTLQRPPPHHHQGYPYHSERRDTAKGDSSTRVHSPRAPTTRKTPVGA